MLPIVSVFCFFIFAEAAAKYATINRPMRNPLQSFYVLLPAKQNILMYMLNYT